MELNLNSLTVDESGRVSLSGLGSGIDFVSAVDQMIAARRIPVDRLEANIEANALKIQAYQDLKVTLGAFQNSLDRLRGAVTIDQTKNIFSSKQAFASVSRTDGAAPSAAANLLGVTVTNSATAGTHEIEVLQVARAHKIGSNSVADQTAALGFSDGDEFTIEGTTITLAAEDSLLDLRDRINAANTGTSPTGVSASIISVNASQHYLVLTKNTAGSDIAISDTTNTPLQSIGILNGSGDPVNELQTAQTAQIYADGLLDNTNTSYESARQTSASVTLGSSGTLRFDDGTTTRDLAYLDSESITTLAANINGDATLQSMGISASIVQEGAQVRLKIVTTGNPFTMSEQGAGDALTDLSINNSRLLIERNSNTINDLFDGLTLSIFQSEVGTNIKVDIEQDLSSIKSEVGAFVEAYNALKVYINGQTQIDETTGAIPEEAVLVDSSTLDNIESRIDQLLGFGVAGVSEEYSVLAQIGITFVDNATLTDPLLRDTLEIDESALDTALLNNADDVRRLFNFDFSTSDPRLTLLSFTGSTTYNAAGYSVNINYDDRYQADAITEAGSFTQTDAQTGGPASDGIGGVAFDNSVPSGQAFRYSYDSAAEELTVVNLTSGSSETIDITANLDAVAGTGLDLGAGQTVDVDFSTLGVTLTLSGDAGFTRGADISDGALDTSGFTTLSMTGGAVATPASGLDTATINALIAAGAYDQATGLLTLSIDGTTLLQGNMQPAAGILFSLDAGPVTSDLSATNIADGAPHTIDLFVNDGVSDVQVASLSFTSLTNLVAGGTQNLTIDLGTGLLAETSTVTNADSPMENYLTTPALGSGSFNVRDSSNTVVATINYNATDSLTDLANLIDADPDLNASIVSSDGTFRLEVTHVTNDTLTFTDDTDSLISQLNMTNNGNSVFSANVGGSADGADDGSITVSNNTLAFTDQSGAEGLQLLYTGNANLSSLQIDFTQGLGSQLYFTVDDILDETTGAVENEIGALDGQNTFTQERIDLLLLERLERQRQSLLERFIAMETALTQMNSILDSIKQTFDVLTADNG